MSGRIPESGRVAYKRGIKSVGLTIDILERMRTLTEVGISELANWLQTTKPTIHRHLQTLVERGYVVRNPINSRYSLGISSYLLGRAVESFYRQGVAAVRNGGGIPIDRLRWK